MSVAALSPAASGATTRRDRTNSDHFILPEMLAVDEAVSNAFHLVNELASMKTETTTTIEEGNDSPVKLCHQSSSPDDMFHQLDQARNQVMDAWKKLEVVQQQKEKTTEEHHTTTTTSTLTTDFRPAFIDMITDAFADVLQDLRHKQRQEQQQKQMTTTNENDIDVGVLVDCLQSGMDLFNTANDETDYEWNDFVDDENDDDQDDEDENLDADNDIEDDTNLGVNDLEEEEGDQQQQEVIEIDDE